MSQSARTGTATAGPRSIEVRYFAAAAEASGCESESLELAATATVGDLRSLLEERYGDAMRSVLRSGSFLVDGIVSRDAGQPLGAAVDILPPFAGG